MTNSTGSLDVLTIAWSKIGALLDEARQKLEEARDHTIDEQRVRHGLEGPNVLLEQILADVRHAADRIDSAIKGCKKLRSL
jgi:hypothetical protein